MSFLFNNAPNRVLTLFFLATFAGVAASVAGLSLLFLTALSVILVGLIIQKQLVSSLISIPLIVLSFIPSNFVQSFMIYTSIGNINLSVIVIVILFFVMLLLRFNKLDLSFLSGNISVLATLLLFFSVSLLSSLVNSLSIGGLVYPVYTLILSAGIFSSVMLSGKAANTFSIIKIAVLTSSIVCLIGVVEFFGIQPYLEFYKANNDRFFYDNTVMGHLPRIVSSLGNPLILSTYLLMIFPMTLYLRDKESKKWLWTSVVAIHFLAILLTMSRSAILVLALITFLFLVEKKKFKSLLKFTFVFPLILVFLYMFMNQYGLVQPILDRIMFNTQSESLTFRLQAYSASIQILIDTNLFLGVGPNMVTNYLMGAGAGLVAHNTLDNVYLMVLSSTGILGLIAYIFILILISRRFSRFDKDLKFVGRSLILVFLTMGFSFNVVFFDSVWGVFWFLSALLILHDEINHKSTVKSLSK